jgi:hypothetical protein
LSQRGLLGRHSQKGNSYPFFTVAKAFMRMAAFYLSRRVERGTWERFISDLEINSKLSLEVDILRI